MRYRYDSVRRLEPASPFADLGRGFAAEVADPAWLLGRQWQLGEHRGEDASSPVRVEYVASLTPMDPLGGDPMRDPRLTPPDAIVEAEPHEWWTPGRRIRIGRAVEGAATAVGRSLPADPTLRLHRLPVPYDLLDGTGYDGQALHDRRLALGLEDAWFGEQPPEPHPDHWDSGELTYGCDFRAGGVDLTVRRHDGGELDWYSVDADAPVPAPSPLPASRSCYASRLRYPGAPNPRWWEIEDAQVDIGGYPPDRAHFPTLLLIELVTTHSDDWFTFPVPAKAGHVLTLHRVVVHDSFGNEWPLEPPADGWSLFAISGLPPTSLVLWPAAPSLAGPVVDDVLLGVDEDANLLWAVERRLHGKDAVGAQPPGGTAGGVPSADGEFQPRYSYRPTVDVPLRWHPYRIEDVAGRRRFVQARLADLSGPTPALTPEPESDLLYDPGAAVSGPERFRHPVHQIEPSTVPVDGLCLERRYRLARRSDGTPVLWTERRRVPLLSPPGGRLRFDAVQPVAPAAGP